MGILDRIFGIKNNEPQSVPIVDEPTQTTEEQEQDYVQPVQPTTPMPKQENTMDKEQPQRRCPKHPYSSSYDKPGYVDLKRLDPMFADVARYVVSKQEGSTSRIQRQFEIGYNRAGKLFDQLEAVGIVGPNNGPKGRDVLIQDMDSLEGLLNALEVGAYQQQRPLVTHTNDEQVEIFLRLRKNLSKQYDEKIVDIIKWIVDEEEVYPSDLVDEFDLDYERVREIVNQLLEIGILTMDDGTLFVAMDDPEIAQMLCDYIQQHCEFVVPSFDVEDAFEKQKNLIDFDSLQELDQQFEEIAEWMINKPFFMTSDLVNQFHLSTIRAINIIDQLTYVKFIESENSSSDQTFHTVLVHKPEVVAKICQYLRDYFCGYEERPQESKVVQQDIAPSSETCYVYLMHDKSNGFYKIGISKDPQYRERTLQSEKPTIDKICAKEFPTRQIAEAIEAALHKSYGTKRLRGEWFNLEEADVINIIKTLS